jgi:hypothetical protein
MSSSHLAIEFQIQIIPPLASQLSVNVLGILY